MINVDVKNAGTEIDVSGDTFCFRGVLGVAGLGMRFNRNRKSWTGPATLKSLKVLEKQPGAVLTEDAKEVMAAFEAAAEKRRKYLEGAQAALAKNGGRDAR